MNALSPQTQLIFDDAISFDTTDHVFYPHTNTVDPPIFHLFFGRQFSVARLFLRLDDLHLCNDKPLKPLVLIQLLLWRQFIRFIIGKPFIMPPALTRHAQTAHFACFICEQQILYRMLLLLSTIIQFLFIRVTRSFYRAFCPILDKKGESCCLSVAPARPFPPSASDVSAWSVAVCASSMINVRSGRSPCVAKARFKMIFVSSSSARPI